MKYIFLFLFAIAMGVTQAQQTIDAPITDVTVFLSQAQVTRKASVQLAAGEHQLVIKGISSRINGNSVVVKGNNAFTILGVKHENIFNQEDGSNPRIAELDAEIADKEFERRTKQSVQAVYREEMEFIKANRNIVGEEGVLAEDIEEMANFWRERVREIEFRKLELDVEIVELNTELNKLYQERSKQVGFGGQNQGQVTISLSLSKAGNVPVELSYVAYDAGWRPNYDVRTAGTSENVQLSYKGKVFQSTGNDWNNVNLTLSSGNPALSGTPPEFYPWRVQAFEYRSDKGYDGDDRYAEPTYGAFEIMNEEEDVEELTLDGKSFGTARPPLVSVTQGTVNTEFNIAVPYTIPSDNQKVEVECQKINLASDYYHYTAPRGSENA
ncbi:MAG: mucoidy inhibitor MuiA family protein, partial [Bacteroidota bacterium]